MSPDRTYLKRALLIGIWVAAFQALPSSARGLTELEDNETRKCARQGLHLLMDGDPDGATELFRQIQIRNPESPLGYVLEGNATWWKIYYATADLIDPSVFDAAFLRNSPYDSHFNDLVGVAMRKTAARLAARRDQADSHLYLALAYALRARLEGLRGRDLATARAGKRMRSLSLTSLRLDPGLTDSYLCLGLYNYFVDTLPQIVKVLSVFIALPGGNRKLGLKQLQKATETGELTRPEAKFLLAKNYSRQNERQYFRSLELFGELAREYPNNPLWPFLAGSMQCRLGLAEECEAAYRQVLAVTSNDKAEARRAVHAAAERALRRLGAAKASRGEERIRPLGREERKGGRFGLSGTVPVAVRARDTSSGRAVQTQRGEGPG